MLGCTAILIPKLIRLIKFLKETQGGESNDTPCASSHQHILRPLRTHLTPLTPIHRLMLAREEGDWGEVTAQARLLKVSFRKSTGLTIKR
jgi:hypothetical protein